MLEALKSFIEKQDSNTVFINLRIIPKAQKTEITEHLSDGSWKIRVKAVPEKGKANDEIESFLKKQLGYAEIEICGGQKDRFKLLRIKKKFEA